MSCDCSACKCTNVANVDKLKEFYELLGKSGVNSKAVVREEIRKILNEVSQGGK